MGNVPTKIIIPLLISIIGIFYLSNITSGHDWGDDFSMYIHHAKNIVEGIDYKDTGYIYNPLNPIAPKSYPPVFPLLLAPVYMLFGLNLAAMKIEVTLIFILSLFMIYSAFKKYLPLRYLILLIATIGFNWYFFSFTNNILSEIPFMFFLYLTLFFINEIYQSDKLSKPGILYAILLGFLLYLTYATRSIGIAFAPSLIIYDVVKNKRISKFTLKVTAIFVALMILQNAVLHSEEAYFKLFLNAPKIIPRIIGYKINYILSLYLLWYNGYNSILCSLLFSVISGLSAVGFLRGIKKGITIFEIFALLYFIAFLAWPLSEPMILRFLVPVIPLYLFYAFRAAADLQPLPYKAKKDVIFIVLAAAILFSYLGAYTKGAFKPLTEGVTKKESVGLFDYVKKETDSKDIFIFSKPRALSLFTGRRASAYPFSSADNDLWEYLYQINANYLIIGKIFYEDRFLPAFVNRYKESFQEVYANSGFEVYWIKFFPTQEIKPK